MPREGTHHSALTAVDGLFIGEKGNKIFVADDEGRLHQLGESILAISQDIDQAAENAQVKSRWVVFYEDDFLEGAETSYSDLEVVPLYWSETETNGGEISILNMAGGVLHIDTNDTADAVASLLWTNSENFNTSLNPEMYVRLKEAEAALTTTTLRWGFYHDADDYCYFEYDTAVDVEELVIAANADGAGEERTVLRDDVGVASGDFRLDHYHNYKLELRHGIWTATIDDVIVGTGDEVHTDQEMRPYLYADNKSATEDRGLHVDYMYLSSRREIVT